MIIGSLFAAVMQVVQVVQVAPVSADPTDGTSATTVAVGANSAPASSALLPPWYRREPLLDARLVPNWNRVSMDDTIPRRRRAVSYSDSYYTRLQIHRVASWLELPVFGAEYWLGQKLISRTETPASWVKSTHVAVAGTLGGLFAVNTITGVWNLYESRHDTEQRALVWSHAALMLASDAGFAYTGLIAGEADESAHSQNRHRNAALTSMGLATAGTLIMWAVRGF